MSYEKKALRLLGGSLSLLTPGDKVSEADGIQMQNWRADQSGALRSRGGSSVITQISGASRIHSIAQWGNAFYYGADTSLYRAGTSGAIATGFDGGLIGMVPMNGFMWVMNRGANGKDQGSVFSPWQIAGPTSAPTINSFIAQPAGAFCPNGTYIFYETFIDVNGNESALSPPSAPITTPDANGDQIALNIQQSADPTVVQRNVYASGGTLGAIYLVLQVNDNSNYPLGVIIQVSDADATTEGIIAQLDHDPPPAASGIVGPYFSRILAFSSAAHVNRLWWTKPDQPSYFPGSIDGDNNNAQWVDVGDDGEAIVWCTVHPRTLVIYKERSVWILYGDPDSGTLQQTHAQVGLRGPRAVANAGDCDYFLGTSGAIYKFDLTSIADASMNVKPVLQGLYIEQGLDTEATTCGPIDPYGISSAALEFGNGQLVVSYQEQNAFFPNGGNSNCLTYHPESGRWYSMRVNPSSFLGLVSINKGFTELYYAGPDMWGAMGNVILQLRQDDWTMDFDGGTVIEHVYQSPFLDCGAPDTTKVVLEAVIDVQMNFTGGLDLLTVKMHYDNGSRAGETLTSSLTCIGRAQLHIPMPEDTNLAGRRCTNFSLELSCDAENEIILHSVYVYYYVEPRSSVVVSSLPAYLGGGKLVQTKELQIEIDTSGGPATAQWLSDLPNNTLAVNDSNAIPVSSGQRNFQLPFLSIVEGRLFQLRVIAAAGGSFRLYGAKVLARVIGVLVEAYEAANGFVWDSEEHDFASGLTHIPRSLGIALYANPIKQARELELQIDTLGPVTVTLLSDLPGNQVLPRFTTTVNTGGVGWRTVRIPLPNALGTAQIEGHLWRLQLSGTQQFKLLAAGLEILPIGVYVEGYEATAGAIWDSRPMDFGTPKAKEARELELDIDTTGANVQLLSDLPYLQMKTCFAQVISTSGRQKVMLPLTQFSNYPEGRLWQLAVSGTGGTNGFKFYGARIKVRAYGTYVTVDEAAGGAIWDSTPIDLGTQKAKQFRELEFELQSYGPVTITLYLDLFGNSQTAVKTLVVDTTAQGRRKVLVPLTQPGYGYGRLMRATISGASAFKVFGGRVNFREVGTLVEAYEASGGAVWDSTPIDCGAGRDKVFDQVRFEMDSDAGVTVQVWTDLPAESLTLVFTQVVSTVGFGRRWITLEMPADLQGRLIQVVVSSTAGFRLFQGDVSFRAIGRYLAVNVPDAYRALDQDFGTERVKLFKKLEVDIQTTGPLTLTLSTNQSGSMAAVYTVPVNTGGLRIPVELMLPSNIRGRLVNVQIGGASAGRLYGIRVWTRPVNEPGASWSWQNFPVEDSEALPQRAALPIAPTTAEFGWADLPVEPTPPEWEWAAFPVAPTDAQWNWVKFLGIDETSDQWTPIDIPVGQGS